MENLTVYLLIFIGFLALVFTGAFIYKTVILGEPFTFQEAEVNESEFGNPVEGSSWKEKQEKIKDPNINPPELGGVTEPEE